MIALVIDDSRAIRRILDAMLGELGITSLEAADGVEGLRILREHGKPNVVLVDWNMPEMNGLEFVKAVRDDPALNDVPLMMVTSETELSQVSTALDAGADEYLMKPFCKECIAEKLRALGVL